MLNFKRLILVENFAKTFVSNMANGDIFYSRLSFGTIQQQFFGIFQFLKGGEFFLPPLVLKVKKNVGTQRVKCHQGLSIAYFLCGSYHQ